MLVEHPVNKLDNFIMGWYHDDHTLIDKILHHFSQVEKTPGMIYGPEGTRVIDKSFKDSFDCCLEINTEMFDRYARYIQPCADAYIQKYPMANMQAPWTITEGVNVQHYPPGGGFFNWHAERTSKKSSLGALHLVFMTYLNTVESGGETEFLHQNLKIKPEKGLTLIWPADWTFTHRGNSAPTEDKFIATGWYHFID